MRSHKRSEAYNMDSVWDGITRAETLNEWAASARSVLADAAKKYDWPRVFDILSQHPKFINSCRPGGESLYAPLHQAAHGGAPVEVVHRLLGMGAWRTLRNARGERPVDIAAGMRHADLLPVLEPVYKRQVAGSILLKIQGHFHAVIRERADCFVQEHALRLPELEPFLESEVSKMWFAVPGMYGGFSFWLETSGSEAQLISESLCRIVGGSGQRHVITSSGSNLVAEGFDLPG